VAIVRGYRFVEDIYQDAASGRPAEAK